MSYEPLPPLHPDIPILRGFQPGKCYVCERRDYVRPLDVSFPRKACLCCMHRIKEVVEIIQSPQSNEETRKCLALKQLKRAVMSRRKIRRLLSIEQEHRLRQSVDELYDHIWPKKK